VRLLAMLGAAVGLLLAAATFRSSSAASPGDHQRAFGRLEVTSSSAGGPSAVHASTIVRCTDGRLLAAFFGGSREGAGDVAIWISSRSRWGGPWSAPAVLAKVSDEAHWNPVLFLAPDARTLWLHFKVGDHIPTWRTYAMRSSDCGRSWSDAREVVPGDESGGRGCVKNKPLVTAAPDGALVCGASSELADWVAFADVSLDNGETFERTRAVGSGDGASPGLIQPALWESRAKPGYVSMLLRSDDGHVHRADSSDGGRSFGPAYSTNLPNNNSGLDLVLLRRDVLVLAYNPVAGNWAARYPLRLAISFDNGRSWPRALDVETEPGEFSYPALIADRGGRAFHLTYTWNRRKIMHVQMSLNTLLKLAKSIPA